MKIKAPAKTNIYLRVIRKRIDGYHEIETIFLPLKNPADTVTLTDSKDGKLSVTCSLPSLSGTDNLCHKAATAFAKSAKIRSSWKIHIRKNIPVAAGLGGGSSDAAAGLKLLHKKYPQMISETEIINLASKIGADVPFFLNPVPSLATGIGEKLKPLDMKCEIPFVIVFPKFPVSAKWAYQNRIRTGNKIKSGQMISALKQNDLRKISSLIRNDLAPALWKKFPILCILRDALLKSGALGVEVSGSGSSLFAIAKSAKSAEKIAMDMDKRFGDSIICHATVAGS
ncbi:MAG: 4-(cytidine 5'-diphospho)-2-C-methyl-D-erythritol kinase [Lentisphaerae bacterium]|nr:4-(cytidine 5'-diphospho)-2-C-methyl-D-erythritol kinase [Lentisphaerota bacterium]